MAADQSTDQERALAAAVKRAGDDIWAMKEKLHGE